jgi:uncharacterized membrane protein
VRRPVILITLVGVIVSWNSALFAAPVADSPGLAAMTYLAGAAVCHQRPERSFHRGGAQYPVCARCLGLYTGALLGVLGWVIAAGGGRMPHTRATRWVKTNAVRGTLAVVAIPTVATVALALANVWDASNMLRAVLAFPLGAVIASVITAVAAGDLR